MAIKLYDLAGAETDRRFSPYCWRTRMALAHKGLEVETIPWRFTEKDAIAFSGQGRVPVLIDGGQDGFQTPGRSPGTLSKRIRSGLRCLVAPRVMPSPALFNGWADAVVLPGIAGLIVADVCAHLHEKDRDYFRTSREHRLGRTLEAVRRTRWSVSPEPAAAAHDAGRPVLARRRCAPR